MHKAQLLAGAEIEEVAEDAVALWPGTHLKVLTDFGEEEVFVVSSVTPV